ncbi:MAG: prepilin-type N-terminal cleavage/methylation domain-containing protein [Gemmatimonadetes bacterium]|nr:prepilin-type N-terminal cleavage/methylation domain-containing protein [Gemmatimonadota bacterium]
MSRRGFTLIEIIIAMTLMAVIGIGFTRILINDSRFVSRQDALMGARQGARAALNTLVAELRMIGDGGLVADSAKKIVARIPFAFGALCNQTGGTVTASLLPVDSLSYNTAINSGGTIGLAYLLKPYNGTYQFPTPTSLSVANSTNMAQCTVDSLRVLGGSPAGKLIDMTVSPASALAAAVSGSLFYLYQTVTYSFENSTDPSLTGRTALFRQVSGLTADELVAPFDTSAGFKCLTGLALTRAACPVAVSSVRGLELHLVSASEKNPQGWSKPETFDLTARIVFVNCGTKSTC